LANPKDRAQFIFSIQASKKVSRTNVVKTKPSRSKKNAYNRSDKRTRAIFAQFISAVSRTVPPVLRRDSATNIRDTITRITPDQKKMKPDPGSVTLPKPSWVAP